jgi:hypothetical protein
MAAVGADGYVCIYAHQPTNVVVDLVGWVGAGGATGGAPAFVGATPRRLLDTRNGTGGRSSEVTPASPASVPVRGITLSVGGTTSSVPASAAAVAINLTVVDAAGPGFATVWPCGTARPTASNVNYLPGRRVATSVVAPIGANGAICVHSHRSADIVVDLAGWFTGGSAPGFVPAVPQRVLDTRLAFGPGPR